VRQKNNHVQESMYVDGRYLQTIRHVTASEVFYVQMPVAIYVAGFEGVSRGLGERFGVTRGMNRPLGTCC
jgi:hypothetical protein